MSIRGTENLAVSAGFRMLVGLAMMAGAAAAWAVPCPDPCTVCWKDPVDGSWSLGSNWNSGRVPVSNDTVCIERDGSYTVRLKIDSEIASLIIDGRSGQAALIVEEGHTLSLNGGSEVTEHGKLSVIESAVVSDQGATLTNDGEISLKSGTLDIDLIHAGSLLFEDSGNEITGSLDTSPGCVIAPAAAMVTARSDRRGSSAGLRAKTASAGAQLTVSGGFTNQCGLVLGADGDALVINSGALINESSGTIVVSASPFKAMFVTAADPPLLDAVIDNRGLIDVVDAPMRIGADDGDSFNRSGGVIRVRASTLEFDMSIDPQASSFTNEGVIEIGSIDKATAKSAFAATMAISGGTFRGDDGSIVGDGLLRVEETALEGDLSLDDSSLNVEMAEVSASSDTQLSNDARTLFTGRTSLDGSLINRPDGLIVVRGSSEHGDALLAVRNGVENRGELRLENLDSNARDVTVEVLGGVIDNAREGTVVSEGAGGGGRRLMGNLVNQGGILISDGTLSVEGVSIANEEDGLIEVESGELEVVVGDGTSLQKATPQFTNAGGIALSSGTRVRVRGSRGRGLQGGGVVAKALSAFTNLGSIMTATDSEFIVIDLDFINQAEALLAGEGTFDVTQAFSALNHGRIVPGDSFGTLYLDGSVEFSSSAVLEVEIGGDRAGIDLDLLEADDDLALAGALDARLGPHFQPAAGDRFRFLSYGDLSGSFDTLLLPELGNDLVWQLAVGSDAAELIVNCSGPEINMTAAADKDLVSLGYEVLYQIAVVNVSAKPATGVIVRDILPAYLAFVPGNSSSQCRAVGGDVECELGMVAPSAQISVIIAAEPVVTGEISNPFEALHNECIGDPSGYSKQVSVRVTSAEPCDATDDGRVDADDLPAAVAHIFGTPAPGNPDCVVGWGIDAQDLAGIVTEATDS